MPEQETQRYRETRVTPPQGRNRALHEYRVKETTGEIPEGCEPTTEDLCDWTEEN
jgi:hypothetical protein